MASMMFWHGYDRLIEGLKNYYSKKQKTKVILHFVGNSSNNESVRYINMVKDCNLAEYVLFHAFKNGDELDEIFNLSDLAIGCLGVHRKGIQYVRSLKNSEYCARGIPFIYSEIDESFEDKNFKLKIKADDSPVDINQLISFVLSNKFEPEKIREFAEKNLSWDRQMEIVLNEINNM